MHNLQRYYQTPPIEYEANIQTKQLIRLIYGAMKTISILLLIIEDLDFASTELFITQHISQRSVSVPLSHYAKSFPIHGTSKDLSPSHIAKIALLIFCLFDEIWSQQRFQDSENRLLPVTCYQGQ